MLWRWRAACLLALWTLIWSKQEMPVAPVPKYRAVLLGRACYGSLLAVSFRFLPEHGVSHLHWSFSLWMNQVLTPDLWRCGDKQTTLKLLLLLSLCLCSILQIATLNRICSKRENKSLKLRIINIFTCVCLAFFYDLYSLLFEWMPFILT